MKKILYLIGVWFCLWQAIPAFASDLKDNSLKLDSRRIEQEEEQAFYQQSEILASLFSEADTQKLKEVKENRSDELDSRLAQLFAQKQEKTDIYQLNSLFADGDSNRYATKLDADSQTKESPAGYLYSAVCLLLVGGAGLLSFLASKEEQPD
ncbi:type VII secretion protein EssA [Streptococcus pantholopis]|uniref:Type VII secretion protein EssA n=1 Tax=Streptococcus pantholopis TaxID=1811193 RepID=A0A172Q956_9STRE|nr:type VII secretion protein EssA [Streptococcus pantholopis]AND80019.1 hypothetical protein A0O21_08390 [Streptococcus pantholopis]